ncbi:MAG: DUF669 domain-containing protein [Planctomycetaceae bacterium]|nr:DUF669 domain-containing protein [Planctomycetaceae bacterium]
MAYLNFDASQVDPSVPFEAIPSDKYLVEITDSEMKPTKNGSGTLLQLEYTVIEGEYKNRKIWDRLCIKHTNQQTVKIALANLSAICHAIGVMKPQDSAELHHIPFHVTVKCKSDDSGEIRNEVKAYAKYESPLKQSVTQPETQVETYPQAPSDDHTPPWAR